MCAGYIFPTCIKAQIRLRQKLSWVYHLGRCAECPHPTRAVALTVASWPQSTRKHHIDVNSDPAFHSLVKKDKQCHVNNSCIKEDNLNLTHTGTGSQCWLISLGLLWSEFRTDKEDLKQLAPPLLRAALSGRTLCGDGEFQYRHGAGRQFSTGLLHFYTFFKQKHWLPFSGQFSKTFV